MFKRRILSIGLVGTMMLSAISPAMAQDAAYDNRNAEVDSVVIARSEQGKQSTTGRGESTKWVDTRTEAEKQDDETQERIDELVGLIEGLEGQIAQNQTPGITIPGQDGTGLGGDGTSLLPDLGTPSVPGNPDLPENVLPDDYLPDYELPDGSDWTPETDVTMPEMPGLENPPTGIPQDKWEDILNKYQEEVEKGKLPGFVIKDPEILVEWYEKTITIEKQIPETNPNVPNQPNFPSITTQDTFDDGEKAFDETYIITTGNGASIVKQFSANLGLLGALAAQMNNMNTPQTLPLKTQPPAEVTNKGVRLGTVTTLEEVVQMIPVITVIPGEVIPGEYPDGTLQIERPEGPDTNINDWLNDWLKQWIKDNYGGIIGEDGKVVGGGDIKYPDWSLDDLIDYPNMDDAFVDFPSYDDFVDKDTIPGTNVEVVIPESNLDLYVLLMKYIQELQSLNHNYTNITKITQFQITDYEIQTIRRSVPKNLYRWVITNSSGSSSVETTTTTPIVKLLFQNVGDYVVRVFNTQDVTRNTKVSGVMTEMWVLSNNDMFDGMVVYQKSNSFSGYIGEDIGPVEEEVELKKSGFIASISESMTNTVQFFDTDGNYLSPSKGYTTERSE